MSITISNNSFNDIGGDGIRVDGDLEVVIDNNEMQRVGGQAVNIIDRKNIDEETRQLILDLQEALNKRDISLTKKIFNALADKSIDLVIALAAGQILK